MSHGLYRLRNWNQFHHWDPHQPRLGTNVQQHLSMLWGPQSFHQRNELKKIKCLQEKLAFVRSWYVHETPAASKEIWIILTHFTSMNLSET